MGTREYFFTKQAAANHGGAIMVDSGALSYGTTHNRTAVRISSVITH